MKVLFLHQKKVALFLFFTFLVELTAPMFAYGLTSGPSQPEMKGFEPIGNSDMVDLFSGDFSYNIPLMDVGGYPINIAYHSGASMDDESSWVGYGWSLSPGAVNRQLRGLPDDFNGTDKMERELHMKDHITKGAKFSMDLDLLGVPKERIKFSSRKKKLNLELTVSVGVKIDNYRGIGMEMGANTGVSLSEYGADDKTAKDSTMDLLHKIGLGKAGITLSSMEGAGLSLNANILRKNVGEGEKNSLSKSIGFGYNTRAGLTGLTLSSSFSMSGDKSNDNKRKMFGNGFEIGSESFISFNGESYTPTIDHPTTNNSFTFTVHLGPEVAVAFVGLGVTGFYSKQKVSETYKTAPAYGYLNSELGKDIPEAVMDMNREKDIPYSKQVKYLPIPIPTNDFFTASSQDGGGQYRAYRGSSGIFFDRHTKSVNEDNTAAVELGAGLFFDAGVDLYHQSIVTETKKWVARNSYLAKGDFQPNSSSDPLYESSYFKRVGEPVPFDYSYASKLKGIYPVAVKLPSNIDNAIEGAKASELLRTAGTPNGENISTLKKDQREVRNTTFNYLNASEASLHGNEKYIVSYKPDSIPTGKCNSGAVKSAIGRTSGYRKGHHISEITITGDDGKRSVYGIPVYNTYQEEVTFSIGSNQTMRNRGLIGYNSTDNSISNSNGRENYYSREKTPAYPTSYLLTAILSPDYIDKTGDGLTDDDAGTGVKFNYTKLDSIYRWRTPYAFGQDSANYNEGFLSDNLDDKASYVYGEKEIWYLHSIESKTMVAHFITEDRDDGLGVNNSRGGVNSTNKLKRLKEIRLYSKSDLRLNGNDPSKTVPIKVVHFVYDYSLCQGLPNSVGHTGKLTLKRIYFTFGQNNKGRLNPYSFSYDSSYNTYQYRQYDRWGNYKNASNNPGSLNNSEYPYTLQDSSYTNKFASAWQLNKINLPSGGVINVTYESDDYAYVQDKRAAEMCMVNGIGSQGSSSGLIHADYIYVRLPQPVTSSKEMQDKYFDGISNLYYKFLIDLDGKGHKEFVPGYAELDGKPTLVGTNVAKIKLKTDHGINPITKEGWQFIRNNLPKYAYPGSENLEDNGSDIVKAIKALVTAFGTIKELIQGFEKRAQNKGYSNSVDTAKSWIRLCVPNQKKLGGGSRVKRIDIADDWATMSGTSGAQTATYSQLYDYTTKNSKGVNISSGVASYEPMLGNDENFFHQPIRYKQSQFLALDNYYYIEEPFCESLFPGANVGYSKVSVKTIGTGDATTMNRTGTVVSEFFTAKDYPVKVDVLDLEQRKPITSNIFKLIGGISLDMVGLSQGYSIELNDMHGKPKSVNVFNKSGQNISSVQYYYKTKNELAATKELDNTVKTISSDGTVSDGTIGEDIEMFTDMRQQTTDNLGESLKISGGAGSIFIFPLPFFFPGIGVNYDRRSYRASSTIKIINRFAIQYKVKKVENGSSITTENLLWDSETGNVLLTKTQNEFDDPIYSFAYPAHWYYPRMGQAYLNLGTLLSGFTSASNGTISNSTYNSLLVPGDELIDVSSAHRYWVVNSPVSSSFANRIIDSTGNITALSNKTVRIVRSGRRNMANTAIGTIVSLNNPIVGDKLDITQLSKVLDAKATVFEEKWSVPVSSTSAFIPYSSCSIDPECMKEFIWAIMVYHKDIGAAPFFLSHTGYTADDIFSWATIESECTENFIGGESADHFEFYQYAVHGSSGDYYINSGDSASLGSCKLYFDFVKARFNSIVNTPIEKAEDLHNCSLAPCKTYIDVVPDDSVACGYDVVEEPCPLKQISINGDDDCGLTDTIMKFRLACPDSIRGCLNPIGRIVNPYLAGILGNWRPLSQYAYHVNRENLQTDPGTLGNTDVRKSGAYSIFNPFWKYSSGWQKNSTNDIRWIAANTVTYFNNKGIEVENKDALNRYSAALFGYLESLPVAVASNAQYREIGFDGFEDYGFNLECSSEDSCNNNGHFIFRKLLNGGSIDTTSHYSHSGKYSLKINNTSATLLKTVFNGPPDSLYSYDGSGRFILGANELSKGFSPIPGKKYVLSFWVKDTSRRNPATIVQATVNGTNLINSTTAWPIVEGWKHVEVQFTLASMASNFILQLSSGGATVYFDDIRIQPFDAQMKTYAYDASSQRLMAELDENNFATYYEYDDEGILVRVKKETERGIMTIKETRSSYRKQN